MADRRLHIHHVLKVHEGRLTELEKTADSDELDEIKASLSELKQSVENNEMQKRVSDLESKLSDLKKKRDEMNTKISELLSNTSNFCEQMVRFDAQNATMNKRVEALEAAGSDEN